MFCSNCGASAKEGQKFCENCGAPLEVPPFEQPEQNEPAPVEPEETPAVEQAEETPAEQPTEIPAEQPAEEPTEETPAYTYETSKKKSHKGIWIAVIVGVLVIAAVALLFVFHPWNRALSPEKMRLASEEAMQDVTSMHMDMTESVSLGLGAENYGAAVSIDLDVLLSMDIQKDPMVTRSEIGMSAMGFDQKMLMYTETVDGTVYSYTSQDNGATWERAVVESGDSSLSADTIAAWTESAENMQYEGTETIDGVEVVLYSGELSSEYLNSAMNLAGDGPLSMLGDLDAKELLTDIGSIPVRIGYDKATNRLVYIQMDATDVFKTLFDRIMSSQMGDAALGLGLSYDVKSVVLDGKLSRFNEVPPIEIPEEAKVDPIIGTWTLDSGVGEEAEQTVALLKAFGMSMTITLNEDGSGMLEVSYGGEAESQPFSYTYEDGVLTIQNGNTLALSIEDGQLILEQEGMQLIFVKE